jgi:hypothetical protein
MKGKRQFRPSWRRTASSTIVIPLNGGIDVYDIACSDHIRTDASGLFMGGRLGPFEPISVLTANGYDVQVVEPPRSSPSPETTPEPPAQGSFPQKTVFVKKKPRDPFSFSSPNGKHRAVLPASIIGNAEPITELMELVDRPPEMRGQLRVVFLVGPVGTGKTTTIVSSCKKADRCCRLFDFGDTEQISKFCGEIFPCRNRVVVARAVDAVRIEEDVESLVAFLKASVVDGLVESNLVVLVADSSANPVFSRMRKHKEDFQNGFCRMIFFHKPLPSAVLGWFSEWEEDLALSVATTCDGDIRKAAMCVGMGPLLSSCLMGSDSSLDPFVIVQKMLGGGPSIPRLTHRSMSHWEMQQAVLVCSVDPRTVLDVLHANYLTVSRQFGGIDKFTDELSCIEQFMGKSWIYYDQQEDLRDLSSLWMILLTGGHRFDPFYRGTKAWKDMSEREMAEPTSALDALERCF